MAKVSTPGETQNNVSKLSEKAGDSYREGDFANAVLLWKKAAAHFESEKNLQGQANSLIRASEACQSIGNVKTAKAFLEDAQKIAQKLNNPILMVRILSNFAKIEYQSGEHDTSKILYEQCIEMIKTIEDKRIIASVSLNYANLMYALFEYNAAAQHYRKAMAIAAKGKHHSIRVKAAVNLIRTNLAQTPQTPYLPLLKKTLAETKTLSDGHDKAMALISIGRLSLLSWEAQKEDVLKGELLLLAHDALSKAVAVSQETNNKRTHAHALGSLGQVYQKNGQIQDALTYTQQALFIAYEIGASDILYWLHWENGRQFKSLDDMDNAIKAYEYSIENIAAIREDLTVDCKQKARLSFRESVGPVYFELADLLLNRSANQKDLKKRQKDLMAAQSTIEQMKQMELQDYFQDDCVVSLKARQAALDKKIPGTAVIYPVLLA
ncbi:MAG: tetratricopeptide repeat protein, partial [Desulfobacteraceae bacterium]|nr:tetratricopeptide repeat protein [Desulfobacteraceae bacterium]